MDVGNQKSPLSPFAPSMGVLTPGICIMASYIGTKAYLARRKFMKVGGLLTHCGILVCWKGGLDVCICFSIPTVWIPGDIELFCELLVGRIEMDRLFGGIISSPNFEPLNDSNPQNKRRKTTHFSEIRHNPLPTPGTIRASQLLPPIILTSRPPDQNHSINSRATSNTASYPNRLGAVIHIDLRNRSDVISNTRIVEVSTIPCAGDLI